jgi:hypothetical protein
MFTTYELSTRQLSSDPAWVGPRCEHPSSLTTSFLKVSQLNKMHLPSLPKICKPWFVAVVATVDGMLFDFDVRLITPVDPIHPDPTP